MARPLGIKIIAWSWVGLGVLLALPSILGMLAEATVRASAPGDSPNVRLMTFLLENAVALFILLFVVALVSIAAGIALYQLKEWGRVVVEWQSRLGVVGAVGFTFYWLYVWTSFVGQTHDRVVVGHVFHLMGGGVYVLVVTLLSVLLILIPGICASTLPERRSLHATRPSSDPKRPYRSPRHTAPRRRLHRHLGLDMATAARGVDLQNRLVMIREIASMEGEQGRRARSARFGRCAGSRCTRSVTMRAARPLPFSSSNGEACARIAGPQNGWRHILRNALHRQRSLQRRTACSRTSVQ